jgi:transcriptional regulator with XRE-family HTH domain
MDEPQIIRTPSGDEMVVISREEYERLRAAAYDEDADDAAIYKARKAELAADPERLLPAPVSAAMLKGLSRFKALRRRRGLTQSSLAAKAGVGQGYLSDIENRRRTGAGDARAAGAGAGRALEMDRIGFKVGLSAVIPSGDDTMREVRPLRSEADYNAALEAIEEYFTKEPRAGSPEADRFDLLALVIGDYERRHWAIEAPDAPSLTRDP